MNLSTEVSTLYKFIMSCFFLSNCEMIQHAPHIRLHLLLSCKLSFSSSEKNCSYKDYLFLSHKFYLML